MTKAVLEAEDVGAAESALAAIPSPSIGVPASQALVTRKLDAELEAALDRLGARPDRHRGRAFVAR